MSNNTENIEEDISPKDKCKNMTLEIIGWGGSILVVIAYVIDFNNFNAFILNTVGSVSLVGICYHKKAYQPLVINIAWVISGLYKYFFTFS